MFFAPLSSGGRSAEHAPRSVDLAWLCCGPTCGALLPTPSVEAQPHQHRDPGRRQRASNVLRQRVCIPRRASRACIASWSSGRPTEEHAPRRAGLAWMCCGPTRGALLPTPSVEARPHQHCDQSAAEDSKCLSQRVWFPWRASRARITPLSSGRRRAEFASRTVDLAWLCVGQLAARFIPTPSDEAQPHQHSDRSEARRSRFFFHRVRTPWRAAHANFALWRIDRPPAGHAPRSADLELL